MRFFYNCSVIFWLLHHTVPIDCLAFPPTFGRCWKLQSQLLSQSQYPGGRSLTVLAASADITIQRGCSFYSIYYDLVESRGTAQENDDATTALPVVVLHGGPGIPSNYLRPLENLVKPSRQLLFWDQLGCGKSDRPDDESLYSIDLYINDLVQLMEETLEDNPFHLYGQSFGGILAFEYLKRERPEQCRSVVLSSTPTNVAQAEKEADRLVQGLLKNGTPEKELGEAFRIAHQVQSEDQPQALAEAYEAAGTTFRGTTAIAEYEASLEGEDLVDSSKVSTPALVLRGQYDFVTTPCIEGWKDCFQEVRIEELEGCAHHGMLEKPEDYGKVLECFWMEHETT